MGEAIEVAEQLRPDIAVLDISMPVMSGLEAARVLRERMPEMRIIFASQHADPTYVDQAFRLGAHGLLVTAGNGTRPSPGTHVCGERLVGTSRGRGSTRLRTPRAELLGYYRTGYAGTWSFCSRDQ
jgi:hypothetical protein